MSPGRKKIWRVRAEEILADGEWHNYGEVIEALMPLVPPGVALRKNESARRKGKPTSPVNRQVQRTETQLIRAGQRSVVTQMLNSGAIFEIEPRTALIPASSKKIRMLTEFVASPQISLWRQRKVMTKTEEPFVRRGVDGVIFYPVVKSYYDPNATSVNVHTGWFLVTAAPVMGLAVVLQRYPRLATLVYPSETAMKEDGWTVGQLTTLNHGDTTPKPVIEPEGEGYGPIDTGTTEQGHYGGPEPS